MFLAISTVAEKTGIPKEVLRKWEARYDFPALEQDSAGLRVYPTERCKKPVPADTQ